MFWNKYPYLDVHEMNLDWILKQLEIFQTRIDELKITIKDEIMAEVQPQLDEQDNKIYQLTSDFEAFKTSVNDSIYAFENQVQNQIANLEADIEYIRDLTQVVLAEAKLYSDIQNDNLYNRIINDVSGFLSQIKVINYITGEEMSIQSMFDYLCMFHLANPLSYTQLALKNITYTAFTGLGITWTDVITNGNILIP